jgi:hypothetical protein
VTIDRCGRRTVHAGIELMYIEGELQAGRLTGRTILVVETSRQTDPKQPGYASAELRRLVLTARAEWERRYEPADIVRLEYRPAPAINAIRSNARG